MNSYQLKLRLSYMAGLLTCWLADLLAGWLTGLLTRQGPASHRCLEFIGKAAKLCLVAKAKKYIKLLKTIRK